MDSHPKKLLDQVRQTIQLKHYSSRTEETYIGWIKCYILLRNKRHPREMGTAEIEAPLTSLAVDQHVAAARSDGLCGGIVQWRTLHPDDQKDRVLLFAVIR